MKNTLQAIGEMWEYAEQLESRFDQLAFDYDNGRKDTKQDYHNKMHDSIDQIIEELMEMKAKLKPKKATLTDYD